MGLVGAKQMYKKKEKKIRVLAVSARTSWPLLSGRTLHRIGSTNGPSPSPTWLN